MLTRRRGLHQTLSCWTDTTTASTPKRYAQSSQTPHLAVHIAVLNIRFSRLNFSGYGSGPKLSDEASALHLNPENQFPVVVHCGLELHTG